MTVKLIHGDCLVEMQTLVDEGLKVDLILTDPPYGTTANKWDKLLDFDKVWECIDDLSTNKTTTLLFGSEPFSTQLKKSNFDDFKYDLYWLKNRSTGFVHAKNKPLKNIELISCFSKGTTVHEGQSVNRMTYNPQGLVEINKTVNNSESKFGTMNGKRPSHKKQYTQKYTNYPKMTFEFDTVPSNKTVHPNQKPVELLEYLIKTYSNEGDMVLDFTMGSGSTAVACIQLKRNFIGIEKEEKYYNIAQQRVNETYKKIYNIK